MMLFRRNFLLCFTLFLVSTIPSSCDATLLVPVLLSMAAAVTSSGVYSYLVEVYAARVLHRMSEITFPEELLSGGDPGTKDDYPNMLVSAVAAGVVPTVQELRETISKASCLVERPHDRKQWNAWAMHGLLSPTPSDTPLADRLLNNTFHFAYRSYVHHDEKGGICRALKSPWYYLTNPFKRRQQDELVFYDDYTATLTEYFWGKRFQRLQVTWYGNLVIHQTKAEDAPTANDTEDEEVSNSGNNIPPSPAHIQWTRTEFIIGKKGSKSYKVIPNPPAAERLRQHPWDIVDEEDGMILFKRGTVGVLAYDRT